MYLKSFKLVNFRKFGTENNVIEFVDSVDGVQSEKVDILKSTTLIVGKNNSGKTTITKALEKLVGKNKFEASDFNFCYLAEFLEEYIKGNFDHFPIVEFELNIGIDSNTENNYLVTNIAPFLNIEDTIDRDFFINAKYEFIETTLFIEEVKKVLKRYSGAVNKYVRFQKYLDAINQAKKELVFYNFDGNKVEKTKFKLADLISIKIIAANKVINDKSLSKVFNKIIQYKYKTESSEIIDNSIDSINRDMTKKVSTSHTPSINGALHTIENRDKLKIRLSSNLDFDILMKELIKYEYIEQNQCIPEGQFGLGYSNLMSIIGEIIDYIEQYPDEEHHSKINLICIEEPEALMHPQMQELFIKNINDAISYLLQSNDGGEENNKNINSQLIVTTHSSHILNSKTHTSDTFNNINYMTILDNYSNVVNLNDNTVLNIGQYSELEGETTDEETERVAKKEQALKSLKFIKKHIKHKVSELFFSDAIIFVEGVTEETLLAYFLGNDEELNKYYISVFNINGAHGLVYHNLIKLLKVPTLIVTDLDIKRSESENDEFSQVTDLQSKITTNKTIINYNTEGTDISSVPHFFEEDNLYITYQSQAVEGIYATSFEEAFILQNYNNEILNSVLRELKPKI